ncbi:MAG TPA: tetratricopeptide repeat protein, partial [Blastocatellia bacterium]|nr:tetratricopeptide repeat protein [Blastocatellia bacterium]
MRTVLLKTLLPILLVVALLAAPAQAKDKWINLTTKNFNIISNADEGGTRKLALKLEQFHFVFSKIFNLPLERSVPTTVMVFKSDASFKPFKPLYNGKPSNIAGYFQGGQDENLIAMDISANQERPMSLIYHEYTHLLTSYTPRDWPVWLKEGLAELYSSFDVVDNKVTLGAPISRHVFLLREKTFIPLQDLLNVRHGSPIYNERDKQGIFYAESWALSHYLMFGDKNARQPQMVEYTNLINHGVEGDKAFAQAFKSSPAQVEKQLRNYIERSSYSVNVYTLGSTDGEKDISVRPVSDAEAQSYLGNLLMRTNRLDEAEALLKQTIEMDPQLARPYEGLGFVALRRNEYDESLEQFKQAVTRGSKNHLAHYYYAEALRRQAVGGVRGPLAQQIAEELRTSIKLMPAFAHAYYALGSLAAMTGENLKEGLEAAAIAVKLEPQKKHFVLALAQVQVRMQSYAAAKKTLEPLLAGDLDPGLKASAESTMRAIEYYTRPERVIETPAPELSRNSGAATNVDETRSSEPGEKPASRVAGVPTLKREGTQTIRGVLVSIECKAGKWTLVVNTRNDLLRFAVSDKDK